MLSARLSNTAHGCTAEADRQPSSVLVVGVVAATWTVTRERGTVTLAVRGFRPLTPAECTEIEAEGAVLLAFLPSGDTPDVRVW